MSLYWARTKLETMHETLRPLYTDAIDGAWCIPVLSTKVDLKTYRLPREPLTLKPGATRALTIRLLSHTLDHARLHPHLHWLAAVQYTSVSSLYGNAAIIGLHCSWSLVPRST